jgi:hypothetical protein
MFNEKIDLSSIDDIPMEFRYTANETKHVTPRDDMLFIILLMMLVK